MHNIRHIGLSRSLDTHMKNIPANVGAVLINMQLNIGWYQKITT